MKVGGLLRCCSRGLSAALRQLQVGVEATSLNYGLASSYADASSK